MLSWGFATEGMCVRGGPHIGDLTAVAQGRALLAMRYGGVLPGAATTAPAQHISSVAEVERPVSELGAALGRGAPNQMRFGGCLCVSELVKSATQVAHTSNTQATGSWPDE